jgi:hypothetical protein
MLRIYAPAAVALLAIGSLSYWESIYSDRFTSSAMTAEEFGKLFASVPKTIGPWVGVDMTTEEETLEIAGAVRHVSRRYTNTETNKSVDLWLIVGHARDICRHTPDICYPSHGFAQKGVKVKQQIIPPEDPDNPATFFTAKFRDESAAGDFMQRVFWAWNGNEEGKYKWEAPEPKSIFAWLPMSKTMGPKTYYGNNKALYKMYFTAAMASPDEPVNDNIAIKFAQQMLPRVNHALFPKHFPNAVDDELGEAAVEEATDVATPAAATAPAAESPAPEAAAVN